MKISIIGAGYVGLVTSACLAEKGNIVFCMDIDKSKITELHQGLVTIYEPGLAEMVNKNIEQGRLFFTPDMNEAVKKSEICFIAVGTPMNKDGSADLRHVFNVAESIGKYMDHNMIIVTKSTVPVGTIHKIEDIINNELNKREEYLYFNVVSNPEFLREGSAIEDCMNPERIIIGSDSEKALDVLKNLYSPFINKSEQFVTMDIRSAEMTKYAANSMLASRISFMNEISQICEKVGADIEQVRLGIGSDSRIGHHFLYAGCGYGGSCFPKDVQALISTAQKHGYTPNLLKKIDEVNEAQKHVIINKITNRFGEDLSKYRFAVWGLSFKKNTDDMRSAPSLTIIEELTKRGAYIKAYDPQAMLNAKTKYLCHIKNIEYAENEYSSLDNADALILITEWDQFKSPNFDDIKNRLKNKIIFDGRNQYNKKTLSELGFEYYKIG